MTSVQVVIVDAAAGYRETLELMFVGLSGRQVAGRRAASAFADAEPPGSRPPRRLALSNRERMVLGRLVEGRSYKQIAGDLDLSLDTVRSYIRALYRKLEVQSAPAAVTRGLREGLV
jgi:DNA-binding NarL/FixJ family response regulator